MGRVLQRVAAIAATTLVGTALTLSGTTASADHDTCPNTHDMRTSASGTVTSSNDTDYWHSSSASTARTFTLTIGGGDATLRLLDSSCFLIICGTAVTTSPTTKTCTTFVPGPIHVEVIWLSGIAPYTLTTNAAPLSSMVPVVPTTGFPSDDCDDGTDVLTSRFGPGAAPVSTKVRTKTVGDETWICYRVDSNTAARSGGKLVVTGPPSSPGATLYTDTTGPHSVPIPAGDPNSGTCMNEGGLVWVTDITTPGGRGYLYVVRGAAGTKVCVRVGPYGGVLLVNDNVVGVVPVVTTGTTCSSTLFTHGNYTLSGGISTTSADLCLSDGTQAVSVSIDQTTNLNRVSWTPDAGTPDI